MRENVSILPGSSADGRGERRSRRTFGLPPTLLEKARARLALLALLFFIFCLIAIAVEAAFGSEATRLRQVVFIVNGVASAAVFAICRAKSVSHGTALNVGLAYEIVMCLLVSLGYLWTTYLESGVPAEVTWTCILIVAFPLIIPSPPLRTLVTAVAAAGTVPLAMLILQAAEVVPFRPIDHLLLSVSPLLCAIIAVAGSRVVYGLNVDVADAQQMGSYRLDRKLGAGGMGEVWRAQHRMLARPAAVKLVRPETLRDGSPADRERSLARFEREAQVTANLHSPHTVQLYDFGTTDDGTFYYVMELLDGLDLETLVRESGPIRPERVVHVLRQACDSLADAHHAGLVHRDIKPANIFLCQQGLQYDFVKVLDFGLVALRPGQRADSPRLTAEGVVSGTPAYMAPETSMRDADAGAGVDIYALGCVAYWLLTGRTVFEGETPLAVILAHVREEPTPPSALSELDIPSGLEAIVMSCLEKEPGKRPRSAQELARRLEACPAADGWSQARARQWWEIHRPALATE